jgi:dTDP-4-dehydrorhamnose reductase
MLAQATARIAGAGRDLNDRAGVYHISASGYTSRFAFAGAIIEMAKQVSGAATGWASVRPITTAEYPPLPALRPLNTTTSKDKIKRAFGIALPDWSSQLDSCLSEFAAAGTWREILAASH